MTNVLTFTPSSTDGCAFYRAHGVLSRIPDVYIEQGNKVAWSSFVNADITFMQRPYTRQHIEVAKMAKDHSPLWVDYDDLLTDVPSSNPAYFTYCSPEVQDSIHKLLDLADVITVSTGTLGRYLAEITSTPIRHIPNAYNDYIMPTRFDDTVNVQQKVLWRGTGSHQGDLFVFNEQIAEAIEKLPDVQFIFAGYMPWMLPKTYDNVAVMPPTDLIQYMKQIDAISPDVTLVPLEDNAFNRCKSNIAELETARSGSIVVGNADIEWAVRSNVVDYDDVRSIYNAVDVALGMAAGRSKELKSNRWKGLLAERALSIVNQERTELIKELLS